MDILFNIIRIYIGTGFIIVGILFVLIDIMPETFGLTDEFKKAGVFWKVCQVALAILCWPLAFRLLI